MSSGQHTLPRSTWLLLVGLTFGWGLNWPIMKIALAQMPVWSFRSMCVIGGAAGMFLIAWAGRRNLVPPPAHWGRLAGTSVFNVALWNVCIAYGLTYLPAGRSVILAYTMPLWVVLLSRRPGRVLADLPVELKRPRAESMLGEPAFVQAADGIWQLIRAQAQAALRE